MRRAGVLTWIGETAEDVAMARATPWYAAASTSSASTASASSSTADSSTGALEEKRRKADERTKSREDPLRTINVQTNSRPFVAPAAPDRPLGPVPAPKKKSIEELRAERLERERAERQRSERLYATATSAPTASSVSSSSAAVYYSPSASVSSFDRSEASRPYNSRFNGELTDALRRRERK